MPLLANSQSYTLTKRFTQRFFGKSADTEKFVERVEDRSARTTVFRRLLVECQELLSGSSINPACLAPWSFPARDTIPRIRAVLFFIVSRHLLLIKIFHILFLFYFIYIFYFHHQ